MTRRTTAPSKRRSIPPPLRAFTPPYAPSWFDRVMGLIDRLPGPYPVWYVAYGVLGFGLITAWRAAAGLPPLGGNLVMRAYGALMFAVPPLVMHSLNQTATKSFSAFTPALRATEEAAALAYRLSSAPALPSLLFSLGGSAFAVLLVFAAPEMQPFVNAIYGPPLAAVFFAALAWFVNSHFAYRVIYQLTQVSRIYSHHARVRLTDLKPHFALSRFTSRAAIGAVLVTTGYLVGFIEVGSQSLTLLVLIPNLLLAASAFVLPLLGAHAALVAERDQAVRQSNHLLETALTSLHRIVQRGDYRSAPAVKDAVTALDIELTRLSRIPTWPWTPGTPRGVAAAVLLPLFIWLVQYALQRLLG